MQIYVKNIFNFSSNLRYTNTDMNWAGEKMINGSKYYVSEIKHFLPGCRNRCKVLEDYLGIYIKI